MKVLNDASNAVVNRYSHTYVIKSQIDLFDKNNFTVDGYYACLPFAGLQQQQQPKVKKAEIRSGKRFYFFQKTIHRSVTVARAKKRTENNKKNVNANM